MYKLSIFLAGFRTDNWITLYNSVKLATSVDFEIIFVGPTAPPQELLAHNNIKFIQDFGNPTRCYQIGLLACTAPHVVWIADDGVMLPKSLDNAFRLIENMSPSLKNVVAFRYYEGTGPPITTKFGVTLDISKRVYWDMISHPSLRKCKHVPRKAILVMNALIEREYMIQLGGFDCRFEQLGTAAPDLSVRLFRDQANIVLGDYFMKLDHNQPDHSPIHLAYIHNDKLLFKAIYNSDNFLGRKYIDPNNWKDVPSVWERRFSQGITK